MRFWMLLFFFGLLIGVPGAHAQCLKDDCSADPKAWADMFGTSPDQLFEQSRARNAAEAVIRQQRTENNAALLADMGERERIRLTYSVEDTLTRLANQPATVLRATIAARGGAYLICGSAIYANGRQGIFVFDTRPQGRITLTATREEVVAANCHVGATILR